MKTFKDRRLEEYEKQFANPDLMSSKSQFRPELAGRLYQSFEQFLSESIDMAIEEGKKQGTTIITGKTWTKQDFDNSLSLNE